jgi:Pentatricopeptide repeat domain
MYKHGRRCRCPPAVLLWVMVLSATTQAGPAAVTMAFQSLVAPVGVVASRTWFQSRPVQPKTTTMTMTTAAYMTTTLVQVVDSLTQQPRCRDDDHENDDDGDDDGAVGVSSRRDHSFVATIPSCPPQGSTRATAQPRRRQRQRPPPPPPPRQPTLKTMTNTTTTTTSTISATTTSATGDYWTQLSRLSRRGQVVECQALIQAAYQVEKNADRHDNDKHNNDDDGLYQSYHCLLDALAVAATTTTTTTATTDDDDAAAATDCPNDNVVVVDHWGHEANQILALLQTRYPETLDVVVYNKVLKVWSACARPILTTAAAAAAAAAAAGGSTNNPQTMERTVAWSHSHALLDRMVQDGLADVISYTTHLSTLAAHATPAAAQQAQDMCQALYNQYYHGSGEKGRTAARVQPTTRTWNMVLLAWVKCGEPARAEQILELMQDLDRDGMRPNVVSYSAVLDGWAKQSLASSDKQAGQQTSLTAAATASSSSSSSTSSSSSSSSRIDPWERMECLYHTMLERSSATSGGDAVAMQPNFWTYVTLIHAYAKRGT